jgi:hypothetical protein
MRQHDAEFGSGEPAQPQCVSVAVQANKDTGWAAGSFVQMVAHVGNLLVAPGLSRPQNFTA